MTQALSAPPTAAPPADVRGEPVRLTADAIALTAHNWQRPPIGKGGFSTVYEGNFYGHKVAVKVLTIRDESERFMFHEELRAMLNPALWHMNICPLLGFCYENPAFIFPKLSPLNPDRLKRLPPDVRDSVCIDVARGLAHMHAAGYVHSDMKPDNVLIEFDAHRIIKRALVGDMGCVKCCTVPVAPFGTMVFLDPALTIGVPRLPNPADDVYSLGVTFLCIFMDAVPASQDDIRRMDHDLALRDAYRSSLVRSMLHPDPAQRPTCGYVAKYMKKTQEELWQHAHATIHSSSPPVYMHPPTQDPNSGGAALPASRQQYQPHSLQYSSPPSLAPLPQQQPPHAMAPSGTGQAPMQHHSQLSNQPPLRYDPAAPQHAASAPVYYQTPPPHQQQQQQPVYAQADLAATQPQMHALPLHEATLMNGNQPARQQSHYSNAVAPNGHADPTMLDATRQQTGVSPRVSPRQRPVNAV
jgi:serine/threonine protein kinase